MTLALVAYLVMYCCDCGSKKDECTCRRRSPSLGRGSGSHRGAVASGDRNVGSMDLQSLVDALKPVVQDAIREEVNDRITDLERRVDLADETLHGLGRLESKEHVEE